MIQNSGMKLEKKTLVLNGKFNQMLCKDREGDC